MRSSRCFTYTDKIAIFCLFNQANVEGRCGELESWFWRQGECTESVHFADVVGSWGEDEENVDKTSKHSVLIHFHPVIE